MKLIKVTQQHIDNGIPCSAPQCPIALALNDAGIDHLGICPQKSGMNYGYILRNCDILMLTEQLNEFGRAFDNREIVEPFEFDFDELKPLDADEKIWPPTISSQETTSLD